VLHTRISPLNSPFKIRSTRCDDGGWPYVYRAVLERHPYFRGSSGRGAEQRFFRVTVRRGDYVLRQGQRGDNFYVLDKGRAQILRSKAGGGPPGLVGWGCRFGMMGG
jgi:CRP-like cAMP-binding protein